MSENKEKKSRRKDYFNLNGIPMPVSLENGEYYLNGTKREAKDFD